MSLSSSPEGIVLDESRPLAVRAAETTPENPWPLHVLSHKLREHIARSPATWVEGQIVEINQRARVTYITLRDVHEEASVPVTLFAHEISKVQGRLEAGTRVVVQLKPDFWVKGGKLSMQGRNLMPVGTGSLLERIDQLRRALAEEGLFADFRKKPLPVLPRRVGLITGRDSDAMKDVIRNASLRWPAVDFEVREVAVQGVHAVREVTGALAELDSYPDIDVIVIARGGGSLEDLLPFSEENMIRAVFAAQTPVVSAIGHEADNPLLDLVADVRASTPTDAGKRVVPDVAEERERISTAKSSLSRAVQNLIENERRGLQQVRSRPVLQAPQTLLLNYEQDVDRLRERMIVMFRSQLVRQQEAIVSLRARVRALSPQQTLERGYAVVQAADGSLVSDAASLATGDGLVLRLTRGSAEAEVRAVHESNI